MKKKNGQWKEICWNIVNSILAGLLVFLGAFVSGSINDTALIAAGSTAAVVMVTKFYDYWKKEETEYTKIFNFIGG